MPGQAPTATPHMIALFTRVRIGHRLAASFSILLLALCLRDAQLAYMKVLDTIKAREMDRMREVAEQAAILYPRPRLLMLGSVSGLILLGALLSWGITRSIVRPLQKAVHNAQAIALGDLSQTLQPRGRDEAAELLTALAQM